MGTPLQADIENSFAERAQGAPARLQEDIHGNIGDPQDPKALAAKIQDYGETQTDPMYKDLWSSSPPPVNVKPIIKEIEAEMPKASSDVRKQLNYLHGELNDAIQGGGNLPKSDAETLHNIKKGIGDRADFDQRVPAGTEANGTLKYYYGKLSDALKTQVPGYRDVTAEAKKYFDWADALKTGTETLGNKDAWPLTFKQKFDAMSPAEQYLVQKGMAAKAGQVVGTGNPSDYPQFRKLVGGDLDFNRENLNTVIGAEPTQNLVRAADREMTFDNTNTNISSVRGSKTAGSLSSGAAAEPQGKWPLNMTHLGLAGRVLQNVGEGIYDHLRGMQRGAMNDQIGRGFSIPPSQALVNALMQGKGMAERARQAAYNAVTNPGMAAALLGYGDNRR